MNNKRFITNQKEIWKLEKVSHNSLSFKDLATNNKIIINLNNYNYNQSDYRINIVVEREFKKYKGPIIFETSYDQSSNQYYMDIDNIIRNLYSILGITYNPNVTLSYSPEYINVDYFILSIFSSLGMAYFIYSNIYLSTLFLGFCLFGLFKGITELVEKINIKKRTDPEEYIALLHLEIIKFQDEPTKTTLTLAKDNVIYKEESSLSVAREYEDYYNNNSNINNYISIPVYKRKNKDKKFYYNQDIENALINFKDKEK